MKLSKSTIPANQSVVHAKHLIPAHRPLARSEKLRLEKISSPNLFCFSIIALEGVVTAALTKVRIVCRGSGIQLQFKLKGIIGSWAPISSRLASRERGNHSSSVAFEGFYYPSGLDQTSQSSLGSCGNTSPCTATSGHIATLSLVGKHILVGFSRCT